MISNLARLLYLIGAAFSITGSFLPWWMAGDLFSYWTPGLFVNFDLATRAFFYVDNGGAFVVLLSVIVLWLAFWTPKFVRRPKALILAGTVALTLYTLYRFLRIELSQGVLAGDPVPQAGLEMVILGSILLLTAGVLDSRVRSKTSELLACLWRLMRSPLSSLASRRIS